MIMPTPLIPSVYCELTCNISVDEYFDTVHMDNKGLFGNKHNKVINLSVAYHYTNVLKSPPPYELKGRYGTILHIYKYLNIPKKKRRRIGLVLLEITKYKQQHRFYTGFIERDNTGGPPKIKPGSIEDHIIADWIEAGLGFRQTTIMVNEYRMDCGLAHVGRNCIINSF